MEDINLKKERLLRVLQRYESLMVAFSGGVDSTLLLAAARSVLNDNVIAVTDQSAFHPRRETEFAVDFAAKIGVRHLRINTGAEGMTELRDNPRDRCYHCKKAMITIMNQLAQEHGVAHIAHGANLDDLNEYRPGQKAARDENLEAPLIAAQLTKADIRRLSKAMRLPTWNKPSMACLATRIPYGSRITPFKLNQIESAEECLFHFGFADVRVRHHGKVARIEIPPDDFKRIMSDQIRSKIVAHLREIGFDHIALDMEGYVTGSMDRSAPGEGTASDEG